LQTLCGLEPSYRPTDSTENDRISTFCCCKRFICERVVVRVYRALNAISVFAFVKISVCTTYTSEQMLLELELVVGMLLDYLENLDCLCNDLIS
jgi:hypothetical protein